MSLIAGPYRPPPVRVGAALHCHARRRRVTVTGFTAGPIRWPVGESRGRPALVLCGDLIRAVRAESNQAVAHWWGVSSRMVTRWRLALGIRHRTPGTAAARRRHARPRYAWAADQDELVRTLPLAAAARRLGRSAATVANRRRALGLPPGPLPRGEAGGPGAGRRWTPDEDRVVRTLAIRDAAAALGRTPAAVKQRRAALARRAGRPAAGPPGRAGEA